jgi:hypothetical protein
MMKMKLKLMRVNKGNQMNVNIKHSLAFWLVLVGFSFSQGQAAQDTSSLLQKLKELKQKIKTTDSRLSQTDSLIKFENKAFVEREDRLNNELLRRKNELKEASERLKGVRLELNKEIRLENKYRNEERANNLRLETLNAQILKEVIVLEDLVQKSIPIGQGKRLERIVALRRDLEKKTASPEEALSRLKALYKEEIRFGDEISIKRTSVNRKDGLLINVEMLRIGNVWAAYMDDEAKYFGIYNRSTGEAGYLWEWREDLNFEERKRVRNAIEVRAARQAPQLVLIPLSTSSIESKSADQGDK